MDTDLAPICESPIIATRDLSERIRGCRLVPGSTIVMYYSPEDLEAEYALLSTENNEGAAMPSPQEEPVQNDPALNEDTPRIERKVRAHKTREPEAETLAEEPPAEAEEVEEPALVAAPATKAVHATVGVAAPEVDVKKIVDESAGATPYTVMLALIAVVGGGAGWKFYQNYAKQKHEQAMKALEIEQSKAERQQNDHQACASRSATLTAQVEALSSKVSQVESRVSSIPEAAPDLGFSAKDFEKLDKRVKAVEKKIQAAKAAAQATNKSE